MPSSLMSLVWLRPGPSSLEADVLREQAVGRPERNRRPTDCQAKPTALENIVKAWTWRILSPWLCSL